MRHNARDSQIVGGLLAYQEPKLQPLGRLTDLTAAGSGLNQETRTGGAQNLCSDNKSARSCL